MVLLGQVDLMQIVHLNIQYLKLEHVVMRTFVTAQLNLNSSWE